VAAVVLTSSPWRSGSVASTRATPYPGGMWLLLTACLLGCPKRGPVQTDPVAELLRQSDVAWERRGELGLEASEEPLDQAYVLEPRNPDVLWRLVRHQVTVGLSEESPRAALYAFAEGRSLGVACLDAVPMVAQARRVSWDDAIEQITPEQQPCVAWTALVWARWIAAHGGNAASLDLPRARLLADTSLTYSRDELSELGRWADGLLLATIPEWAGRSVPFGLSQLDRVRNRRRQEVHLHADRLLYAASALTADEIADALQELRSLDTSAADHAAAAARVEARFAAPTESP